MVRRQEIRASKFLSRFLRIAAAIPVAAGFFCLPASAQTAPETAALTLGGSVLLRLTGADADDRIAAITDRVTPILAHPDIKQSDIVVYTPPGGSPCIYVLGGD